MRTDDVLQEIPDDYVLEYAEKYFKREWPFSVNVYYYIQTCYKWRKKDPSIDLKLLYVENNIDSGVFVGLLKTGNKTFGLTAYVLPGHEDVLKDALENTTKIPWSHLPLVESILLRIAPIIQEVVTKKGYQLKLYVDTTIQVISIKAALKLDVQCPAGVYIDRIKEEHVNFMFKQWPLNNLYTEVELLNCIKLNIAYGVFNENDELLAWITQSHYGGLASLQTVNSERNKGYATLLVKYMSKQHAQISIQPHALITSTNLKSLSLFRALGFQQMAFMKWYTVQERDD